MKTHKILACFAAVLLCFTACNDDYLETLPTNAVAEDDVFASLPNAWAAVNGIHRDMFRQHGSMDEAGQSGIIINMDVLGEDVVMTTTGNGWFNTTYQWVSTRSETSATVKFAYRFYYKIIANANMIITNIDKVPGDQKEKNAIKGQALVYRAFGHFMLVQLFAKRYDRANIPNTQPGVPLMTINTTEGQPRASVEDVYTQINLDLDEAITLLSDAPTRRAKSHFNVNVAKGVKARVALTTQDWTTAATNAAEARQGFTLMTNAQYMAGFNDLTNAEWMWGSDQLSDQQTFFHSFFAFMSGNFNSTNIRTNPKAINSTLYNLIPASDVRKGLWDPTGANTQFPIPPSGVRRAYMSRKFLAESSSSSVGDVPYMRMAEMYLIEAEARAQLGQSPAAATLLHTLVSNRDANYTLSVNTGQALVNEILIQRRIELWGEGFRFLDLKRTNSALDRTGSNHTQSLCRIFTVPAGDLQWEYLIPRDELNTNSIGQNPL
jgi:starch-binding outer membrane protein, SusD/RagB family